MANSRRFGDLGEFFALSAAADLTDEFTVTWVDCAAGGANLGRGVLLSGNFAPASLGCGNPPRTLGRLSVPNTTPLSLINQASLKAFNALYYLKPEGRFLTHYAPFFYPLDGIERWNCFYGPRGVLQYQCVLPPDAAEPALREILGHITASRQGSFLAVLKRFGDRPPPGLLSFPRPGATLALDVPLSAQATLPLLKTLDAVVAHAGGARYPAKDARMDAAMFRRCCPRLEQFLPFLDPRFSSGFSRRVIG